MRETQTRTEADAATGSVFLGKSAARAAQRLPRVGLTWVVWGRYCFGDSEIEVGGRGAASAVSDGGVEQESGGAASGGGQVLVVTGRGLHSKGDGPVIKPAVESLIRSRGVEFAAVQGNGGCLMVPWPLRRDARAL